MAIVNSLTFNPQQGGIVSDEESWHLRLRKTHHTEYLLDLLPEPLCDACDVVAVYGGVGNPSYHYEVVHRVRALSRRLWREEDRVPATVEEVARWVLEAFHEVSRRLSDDKLRFLYGFGLDDLTADRMEVDGESFPIEQRRVRERALRIANLEEGFEDAPLTPPNHACLVGWDPQGGFQGFCLKQENGVLSFQAGGFESLGAGRYAASMSLQKTLGRMTLPQRNEGMGMGPGLVALLVSVLEAGEHFGQVGGTYHFYVIDGTEKDLGCCLRHVHGDEARLAVEIARAARRGFLGQDRAADLLVRLVSGREKPGAVEEALFGQVRSPRALDLALRGYKIGPGEGSWPANAFDGRAKTKKKK